MLRYISKVPWRLRPHNPFCIYVSTNIEWPLQAIKEKNKTSVLDSKQSGNADLLPNILTLLKAVLSGRPTAFASHTCESMETPANHSSNCRKVRALISDSLRFCDPVAPHCAQSAYLLCVCRDSAKRQTKRTYLSTKAGDNKNCEEYLNAEQRASNRAHATAVLELAKRSSASKNLPRIQTTVNYSSLLSENRKLLSSSVQIQQQQQQRDSGTKQKISDR